MAGADPLAGLDLGAPSAAAPDPANKKKPLSGPDPLAGLDLGAPSLPPQDKPPTPMPAAMTYDPNDPNAGWGDWALSKLHNFAVGGNQFNRVMSDSASMGGLDKLQSLAPGSPDVATLRAQTEQSRKDIGPVASTIADVAGYSMAPGSLALAKGSRRALAVVISLA